MNERQLRWLEEAEEVSSPLPEMGVTLWTVADEAALEGLLVAIGREQWWELQEYLERHPECRCRWSGNQSPLGGG